MTDRRRRGTIRSSNCFQTSSAFGFLFFMVYLERKVDNPDRVGIFERQLTVQVGREKDQDLTQRTQRAEHGDHREKSWLTVQAKKEQRLNRARARKKCGAKRKRAKPRSARRFTRE